MSFRDPIIDGARLRVRRSFTSGATPSTGELRPGEIAANTADGTLHVGLTSGASSTVPSATGIRRIVQITQEAYNLITPDADTLYVIT